MLLLFGSRETGGMSNSKKTTKTWFQDGESGGAPNRGSGRLGVRDRSPVRSRSLRLVAASLAGLVGVGAASFGAVAAQANTVAVSASSVSVLSENLASAQGLSRSLADSTIEPSALSASAASNASASAASNASASAASKAVSQQAAASKYATASKQTIVSKHSASSKQASSSRQTGKSKAAQKRDLKATIQTLVDNGYPGALAAKTDKNGNAVGATAGKGNLATGEAPPLDGEVRIASNTKTFVAVLIMKMVEEGKVKLDEPIETYLPGIVKGQGVDGKKITVRQLLQHTSGLPDFGDGQLDYFAIRNDYVSPRDVLDGVLSRPAQFAPGAKFQYNNANYIVLGLLAERVAKRPIAEQIETKIVKPLGLKHTYMPAPGEKTIRGKHPHGYHTRDGKPGKLEDITEADPSWEWAAGSMISTPSELNKFMQSVFDGSLLSQASISEMKKSVPAPEMGGEYGLGLIGYKSSCGVVWGHSGNNPGFHSLSAVGSDGTASTIVTTAEPAVNAKEAEMIKAGKYGQVVSALDKTVCGK